MQEGASSEGEQDQDKPRHGCYKQEGGSAVGDEARCLNGSFIARCKKEESQWDERIKTKSNPGMGRCQKEEAQ